VSPDRGHAHLIAVHIRTHLPSQDADAPVSATHSHLSPTSALRSSLRGSGWSSCLCLSDVPDCANTAHCRIVHHFLTIFAISFTVSVWEYTESMTYMVSAVVWWVPTVRTDHSERRVVLSDSRLFQATTEQPTFVGLLGCEWDFRELPLYPDPTWASPSDQQAGCEK
jgi:hypothetical protein